MYYLRITDNSFGFVADGIHAIAETDIPITEEEYAEFFKQQDAGKQFKLKSAPDRGAGLLGCIEEYTPEQSVEPASEMSVMKEDLLTTKLALIALLHDRVYNACVFYINQTYISVEDMKNLKHLFEAYSGLGGNGLCHELYARVLKLPLSKI